MKYIQEFLEQKYRIRVLGELKLADLCGPEYELYGVDLVIDGFTPNIQVWYSDYSDWLEEKYQNLLQECENKI